ncbi:MAG: glycosyltransferase [Peptococcaceae bacterium]|nr:glycosyltransferase [Peptococcaceae bacterium]
MPDGSVKMLICDDIASIGTIDNRPYKECRYLISKGYNVEILLLSRMERGKGKDYRMLRGIPCVIFRCRGKITDFLANTILKHGTFLLYCVWYLKYIIAVRRHLASEKADYLHGHNLYGILAVLLAGKKEAKRVYDMRELIGFQANDKGAVSLIKQKLSNFAEKRCSAILHVHPYLKEKASRDLQERYYYLPNYPDAHSVSPLPKSSKGGLNIAYIGAVRSAQRKYFEILAKACSEIESVRLSIHGGGGGLPEIKELAKKYPDKVFVTGIYDALADTNRLFSECDLLYCAYDVAVENWRLALPIKMFEAIATGTPLIVSKGAYIEKFILENDIGFAVDASNEEELRALIASIAVSPNLLKIKTDNVMEICQSFLWENVVTVLDEVYSPIE